MIMACEVESTRRRIPRVGFSSFDGLNLEGLVKRRQLVLSLAAAATAALFAWPADAAQVIKLTAVSGYSPTAVWVNVFQSHFIPEVDKKLAAKGNYKIEWNQAWGTIAKPRGEFDAIQYGLGDLGVVQTVFHPDKEMSLSLLK